MHTEQAHAKKILFACVPGDGHFNPLTGLAKHLQQTGYDVRWYTSNLYKKKLDRMQIPHYDFVQAKDIPAEKIDELFPERSKIKNPIKKLNFDLEHYFIRRGPEYYADIRNIQKEFDFDLLIADVAFTGIPFVKDLLQKPVISIGVFPLTETSKDLPPSGLGMEPSYTLFGKVKQAALRFAAHKILFGKVNSFAHKLFKQYAVKTKGEFIFDIMAVKSDYLLQSGTPGFEYRRSDLSERVRYIGSLLPYRSSTANNSQWYDARLSKYEKVVVLTQGTVERDVNKLLVPALEAFKNSDVLVICTTGGSQTEQLRKQYPQQNIIIEDFISFDDVMPYADAYITNGGYGGVMLGIEHRLPMVVAGINEGKNEICARIGYFKYGVNLKTETPTAEQLRKAVNEVLRNAEYKQNIEQLGEEFAQYNPNELTAKYVQELIGAAITSVQVRA
ncbi:glycosyltransferase [Lacibacter luteus]|uniref:Glycosyltransferase n=1 Tax=Lacibacter luteus TaxID=2508719 RepID=A0A4Q1CJ62_9BACT|nr:nucleotide disphospho-sugar-binding domain-containing protein [Lacibacter luteus]RXK60593.1 glycosyltransferase [Lacibacter luteus]